MRSETNQANARGGPQLFAALAANAHAEAAAAPPPPPSIGLISYKLDRVRVRG